uniref:Uncharacterized protein LOC111136263 isoform X4 n=1 Tax=Crassostrea virginica TaxID=6565 RepID=A0A8B8ESI2_CRAVI|nr:uncharacterized protein LOC111136263 isoform X4 [Crassostrea virginica]
MASFKTEINKASCMDRQSLIFIFVGLVLMSILLCHECKKVEGYKFAVYTTEACPRNKTEWEKRESLFNCSKESSSYACLPNENITELLEFCYPLQVLASHEDICLFLVKKSSDVDSYDCTHFDHGCPTGFYTGATMYKYQSCLSIGNGCFLAEPSCERATQPTEPENPHGSSGSETIWIPILVGTLVLFAIFVLSIVIYKRRNRKQHPNDKGCTEAEEMILKEDKVNDFEGRNRKQQPNVKECTEAEEMLLKEDKVNDFEGRNRKQQPNVKECTEAEEMLLKEDKVNDFEGRNRKQQPNDEECPEAEPLLFNKDKVNDFEGICVFELRRGNRHYFQAHTMRKSTIGLLSFMNG